MHSRSHRRHNCPTLEIALFSDFGTGLYHSRYIAKQLVEGRFPYAIHVGDVYYSGRKSEFRKYMTRPLSPLFGATELFLLNSNHEMYSGGKPYFRFLDDKRAAHSDRQKQEGSYFCLRSKRFQILGIDTAYHEDGRFRDPNLLEWLDEKLREGRSNGQTNILLSANHPYEYGKVEFSKLFRDDLGDLIGDRVDLWFWGNTHYCALFDRGPRIPFHGSCIGHGGQLQVLSAVAGHCKSYINLYQLLCKIRFSSGDVCPIQVNFTQYTIRFLNQIC